MYTVLEQLFDQDIKHVRVHQSGVCSIPANCSIYWADITSHSLCYMYVVIILYALKCTELLSEFKNVLF